MPLTILQRSEGAQWALLEGATLSSLIFSLNSRLVPTLSSLSMTCVKNKSEKLGIASRTDDRPRQLADKQNTPFAILQSLQFSPDTNESSRIIIVRISCLLGSLLPQDLTSKFKTTLLLTSSQLVALQLTNLNMYHKTLLVAIKVAHRMTSSSRPHNTTTSSQASVNSRT